MTRESIKTGATVEAARVAAMLELGLTEEDDFHMEVLKLPTKKCSAFSAALRRK